MRSALMDEVAAILRTAATEAIVPRFRALGEHQIAEKSPGEIVTVVDTEVERIVAPQLTALLAGSRVVGEEAAAARPGLLDGLDQGDVWLLDPLDGTANFVAGNPDFAVMAALLRDGETVASWILHPVGGWLVVAGRGEGTFIDGARVRASAQAVPAGDCRGSVLTGFLPPELKAQVAQRAGSFSAVLPGSKCAGVDYPAVATGAQNFLMYWRLLPWDHAPGALLIAEAGGHVAHLDGSAYRPADRRPGLLVAENREVWEAVRAALIGSYAPGDC